MSNQQENVFKSIALIAIMVLFFKVIGFIKQAVIAYYYGANLETDLYYIAYGFIIGVSEALVKALSVSMISVYTQVRIKKGREHAQILISRLLEFSLLAALLCIMVVCFLTPQLSRVLALKYSADNVAKLSTYLIMLSAMGLFTVVELVGTSVLDSEQQYYVPRLQSLLYSICAVLACVFFSKQYEVKALIFAQYVSAVLYSIVVWRTVERYVRVRPVKLVFDPYIKQVLWLAFPLLIGNSAIQINQIVDRTIASGLPEGAVSALSYCHVLAQFVTNILIVNVGSILFAHFSNLIVEGKIKNVQEELAKSLSLLVCILIPIFIVTTINAREIVEILYYRGAFSATAVDLTSVALIGYAISFPFVGVRDLLTKSMYAYQDTRRPMITSLVSIICNIIFSILLSRWFGILGIAIGASIAIVIGTVMNLFAFKKSCNEFSYHELLVTILKSVPAGLLSFAGIYTFKIMANYYDFNLVFIFTISTFIGFFIFFVAMLLEKEKHMCLLLKAMVRIYDKKQAL